MSTIRHLAPIAVESISLATKAKALGAVALKSMSSAKRTDRVIRSRPYESIGIAFGLGFLLGCMVKRRES